MLAGGHRIREGGLGENHHQDPRQREAVGIREGENGYYVHAFKSLAVPGRGEGG
jgi:hypothetical protein